MEQLKQQLIAIGNIMGLGITTLSIIIVIGLLFVRFASFLLPLVLIICISICSIIATFWVGFLVACVTNKWDLINRAYGDKPETKDRLDIRC